VVEKIWNFEVLELFLRGKKGVDSVHGLWITSGLGPWWTMVVQPGALWHARWSSTSGRSGSPALCGDSRGGGVGHGGLTRGLTRAQEAVERRRDSGEGGGGGALSTGSLRARREGKEGRGRSGEERGCQGTLLLFQRGAGRLHREENRAAGSGAPLWAIRFSEEGK
jgi:hypothetical protein